MFGSDEGVKPVPKSSDHNTSSLLQNACALALFEAETTKIVSKEKNENKNLFDAVREALIMINWFVE